MAAVADQAADLHIADATAGSIIADFAMFLVGMTTLTKGRLVGLTRAIGSEQMPVTLGEGFVIGSGPAIDRRRVRVGKVHAVTGSTGNAAINQAHFAAAAITVI